MSFQLPFRKKSEPKEPVDMNDATSSDGEKTIPSFPFLEKPAVSAGVAGESPVVAQPKSSLPGDELERLRQSLDSAVQEALRSFHAYLAALGGAKHTVAAVAPPVLEPLIAVEEQKPAESFPLARLAAGRIPGRKAPRTALSAALKEKLEKGLAEAFAAEEAKSMLPPARIAPAKPTLTPPPLPVAAVIPAVVPIAPLTSPFSTVEAMPSPFAVVAPPQKEEAPKAPKAPKVPEADFAPALPGSDENAEPVSIAPAAQPEPPAPPPVPVAEIPPVLPIPPPLPTVMPEVLAPFSLAQPTPPAPPPVPAPSAPEAPAPLPFSPFQGLEPAPPPPLLDKAPAASLTGISHLIIAENAPAWNPASPPAPPPVFAPTAVESTPAPVLGTVEAVEMNGRHSAAAVVAEERSVAQPPILAPVETVSCPPAPPQAVESIPPPAQSLFGSTQAATAPFRLGDETAAPPATPAAPHTSFNPFALPSDEEPASASTTPEKSASPALESTPSPAQRLAGPEEPPAEIAFNFTEMLRAAGQQRPS